jgi:hypothetical protein
MSDAHVDGRAFEPEQGRQHGHEEPGEHAVEQHLEDAVEGDEARGVLRISAGQLVPDDHHGDAARQAHHDEPDHVLRVVVQEDDREEEHDPRADQPVLDQRQPEDPVIAEHVAELLVPHLGERRIHHHDQADGDGYVGGADAEAIDERWDAFEQPAQTDPREHGEEDPERQIPIEERKAPHESASRGPSNVVTSDVAAKAASRRSWS